LGVYVPTPRKAARAADLAELRAAADRLAEALAEVDEEQIVTAFKKMRRQNRASMPTK
jgi:anti-sigma factor RsiW